MAQLEPSTDIPVRLADIEILRNKLQQLELWKAEVALPAIEENEQTKTALHELQQSQLTSEAELSALKEENEALLSQVSDFEEQQEEWTAEQHMLRMEISQLSHQRVSSAMSELEFSQSMTAQYKEIDKLRVSSQRSNSDLLESQSSVAKLLEENISLEEANTQMREKIVADEVTMATLHTQLSEMKVKWADALQKCEEAEASYALEREKSQKVYDLMVTHQIENETKMDDVPATSVPFYSNYSSRGPVTPVTFRTALEADPLSSKWSRNSGSRRSSINSSNEDNLCRDRSHDYDPQYDGVFVPDMDQYDSSYRTVDDEKAFETDDRLTDAGDTSQTTVDMEHGLSEFDAADLDEHIKEEQFEQKEEEYARMIADLNQKCQDLERQVSVLRNNDLRTRRNKTVSSEQKKALDGSKETSCWTLGFFF